MRLEEWLHLRLVQHGSTICLWNIEPKDEEKLDEVIQWKPGEKRIQPVFNNSKHTQNDPIDQPLFVVFRVVLRLQRLERCITWVHVCSNDTIMNTHHQMSFSKE
eukprot:TRINITY_DN1402_c0_g1_i1.p1 TRINITY_DN1402_c0_g1~~TRINITY_DN1402_c0_g1_i1.p1  ORF type:complete len:104 (-),score=7.31 TRINITY_DN1402_c0_g1_i1:11-322(-)